MENAPIVSVEHLKKYFISGRGKNTHPVKAVEDVSFSIDAGTTFGLVGESGCGKTTVGRMIMRLCDPTGGNIFFEGNEISRLRGRPLTEFRKRTQMVFQDPFSSLDPHKTVLQTVTESLEQFTDDSKRLRRQKAVDMLEKCGMNSSCLDRYPHEFSGGQRQRICIARALMLKPAFVVCDEPVSALDVSVQAQIINLLEDLQEEEGVAYLFISHDLSVVEHVSDTVGVMYLGKIVEIASTKQLFDRPLHPYTQALLSAVPVPDIHSEQSRIILRGDVPSADSIPDGCPFHTRCPRCGEKCLKQVPELTQADEGHYVSCLCV